MFVRNQSITTVRIIQAPQQSNGRDWGVSQSAHYSNDVVTIYAL